MVSAIIHSQNQNHELVTYKKNKTTYFHFLSRYSQTLHAYCVFLSCLFIYIYTDHFQSFGINFRTDGKTSNGISHCYTIIEFVRRIA